jgi:hypothetical protein
VVDLEPGMFPQRTLSGLGRAVKSALAGLLVFEVLIISLLSASPSLHRHLHHDGAKDDPSCAVCAFVKGQVDSGDVAVAVAPVVFSLITQAVAAPAAPLPSFDYCLSPSRAPPISDSICFA